MLTNVAVGGVGRDAASAARRAALYRAALVTPSAQVFEDPRVLMMVHSVGVGNKLRFDKASQLAQRLEVSLAHDMNARPE